MVTLAALAAGLVVPSGAQAKVKRYQFDDRSKIDGRVLVVPDRWEGEVFPGQQTRIPMTVLNRTDEPVTVTFSATDLEPHKDPNQLIAIVDDAEFGAGSWVKTEIPSATLQPMEQIEFDAIVTPPADAPVGTNFAGIVTLIESDKDAAKLEGAKVGFRFSALSQLFLTIPGEIKRDTRIVRADVSDTFMFHGSGFVSYEVEYENVGNVNDHIDGKIVVKSMFGNIVTTLNIKEYVVLRGSRRVIRVIWPKPPRFGHFTAEVRLQSDESEEPKRADFPAVTILPPWWWFVILAVAILLPIAWTIRQRRNDWKRYLDDEWDEEWDLDEDEDLDAEFTS